MRAEAAVLSSKLEIGSISMLCSLEGNFLFLQGPHSVLVSHSTDWTMAPTYGRVICFTQTLLILMLVFTQSQLIVNVRNIQKKPSEQYLD